MLTLPEELLLLSLDDKGHSHDVAPANLDTGLLAAAVLELHLRGRVDLEPDSVTLKDGSPTGDSVLDEVQALLARQELPGSLEAMLIAAIKAGAGLRERVLEQLIAKGEVSRVEGRVMWLLPSKSYAVEHGAEEISLLERLLRALVLNHKPDRRTSALLALLASCFGSDAHLRERLFAELRDRMYEIVNSGGEVQGVVRDAVCGALATTGRPFAPLLAPGAP
jgi:hypothetical protein